jgi:purine nucleoside phosphorylase
MKFKKSVFKKAQPQFGNPALHCWYSDVWLPLIIECREIEWRERKSYKESKGFEVGVGGPRFETLAEAKKLVLQIAMTEGTFRHKNQPKPTKKQLKINP